jgi:hypothetical protein
MCGRKRLLKSCRSELSIQEEYKEYERVCVAHCTIDVLYQKPAPIPAYYRAWAVDEATYVISFRVYLGLQDLSKIYLEGTMIICYSQWSE